MQKHTIWCLFGFFTLASVAWPQAKSASGGTEKAVAGLEQKWLDALKAGDPGTLAPLLADGFVNTSAEAKVTGKAETLADAKTMKWESVGNTDVKVTVFGNTAIATGVFSGKGTDPNGKAIEPHERWTDTWVKMPNGKWQCVASQATPAKT